MGTPHICKSFFFFILLPAPMQFFCMHPEQNQLEILILSLHLTSNCSAAVGVRGLCVASPCPFPRPRGRQGNLFNVCRLQWNDMGSGGLAMRDTNLLILLDAVGSGPVHCSNPSETCLTARIWPYHLHPPPPSHRPAACPAGTHSHCQEMERRPGSPFGLPKLQTEVLAAALAKLWLWREGPRHQRQQRGRRSQSWQRDYHLREGPAVRERLRRERAVPSPSHPCRSPGKFAAPLPPPVSVPGGGGGRGSAGAVGGGGGEVGGAGREVASGFSYVFLWM